jgi:ribosome-associated protein
MIEIKKDILIEDDELNITFSRSSGPGGQNVNKVNTKVTLLFNVDECAALDENQKHRIKSRLRNRIDKSGVLRVICQEHRTQLANRRKAVDKFVLLLQEALEKKPLRKKAKIPYAVKQKRLEEKKRRGVLKRLRSKRISVDM